MRKTFFVYALAAALALPLAAAQAQTTVSASEAEGSRLWFVELSGAPTADGNTLTAVQSEKAAFRKAAAAAGISYVERRSFDVLFNGLSIAIGSSERLKLSRLSGVKALYPVEIIQAPIVEKTNAGAAPDLATAIAMTGADIAQNTLGLSGVGVKVAVMDTGIDFDHPDLGGNGVPGSTPFPSVRVTHGYDFVGDAYNADPSSPSYNPVPTPDAIPDDCNGHGTHVAGIIGANGKVRGVAPGVTFGAYRVFGCDGSTEDDIMLAAMERAQADGMQVLNMSIGEAYTWRQSPTGRAGSRLVNAGMVVVASIGNSGDTGLYSAGAPGVGKNVIGVASFDNTNITLPQFNVSPDGKGRRPAGEAWHRGGGVDWQRRRAGLVRRGRAGHRQERDRRRVVRQHARESQRLFDYTRQHAHRLHRGSRRAAAASDRQLPNGAYRDDDHGERCVQSAGTRIACR